MATIEQGTELPVQRGTRADRYKWMFPKNKGTPKWTVYNQNPIKMDDLGVPLFLETPKWSYGGPCLPCGFSGF